MYSHFLTPRNVALALALSSGLVAAPASADPILRFSETIQGGLEITGNTLGLSGTGEGLNEPGTSGSISAFMGAAPESADGAFPAGTTADWEDNASAAELTLPEGAVVVYAELVWGASWAAGTEDVSASVSYTHLTLPTICSV